MKVGDRIRVFEILEAGQRQRSYAPGILGLQRPETGNDVFECPYLFLDDVCKLGKMNFSISSNHAKHVTTMVITKIK